MPDQSTLQFMQYFDLIDATLQPTGQRLEQREGMRRLNSARVELKHNGTLPSTRAIDGFGRT